MDLRSFPRYKRALLLLVCTCVVFICMINSMLFNEEVNRRGSDVKILVGVMTVASKLERRSLLRMAYRLEQKPEVTIKFVIARPKNVQDSVLLSMESLHYKDILLLDCDENLNAGKTYSYFSTVASMGEKYTYVMKTDDDSYVHIPNLVNSLQNLSRIDVYYGYILPCENTDAYQGYMAGMGYLLSWDLVEWIHTSELVANNTIGTEDMLVGSWLDAGGKGKFRVNKKPMFYDHPEFGGNCAHEFTQDTILIHQLKSVSRWMDVLSYFEGKHE